MWCRPFATVGQHTRARHQHPIGAEPTRYGRTSPRFILPVCPTCAPHATRPATMTSPLTRPAILRGKKLCKDDPAKRSSKNNPLLNVGSMLGVCACTSGDSQNASASRRRKIRWMVVQAPRERRHVATCPSTRIRVRTPHALGAGHASRPRTGGPCPLVRRGPCAAMFYQRGTAVMPLVLCSTSTSRCMFCRRMGTRACSHAERFVLGATD